MGDIMTNHMHAQTNKTVLDKYMKLDQGTRVQALYIWIDGTGEGLRSKTKTLEEYPNSVADLPIWNYDGSSCYQAEGSNSDTYLHPVKFYPDPFRGGKNIMVIFNVICSKMRVDYITRESLRNFYENFSGLEGDTLEKVATEGYRSMSANGDYELDYKSYKLLFSNFLLGRTIYGPGKYIFGCFDNRDMNEPYKIVYDM